MADDRPSLDDLRIDASERAVGGGRRGRGLLVAALVAVLLGAGGFLLWRANAAPVVKTATVREDASAAAGTVLEASGYVTARRRATISSKVTGKVVEVAVEEGMRVEEGQVLARLDDTLQRRQLELTEARLAAAESAAKELAVRLAEAELTLRRSRELAASGVAPQAQLDADQAAADSLSAQIEAARDQVEVAAREVALSRQQLDDTVIRAPYSGVAVSKDAQPGEMISPVSAGGGFTRTGIATIVDMASLEIEVDVNEAYIHRVRSGQRVEAVLDAYPDWRVPARVITAVPTADRQKATVRVRIAFQDLDPRILPDMGVKVAFLAEDGAAGSHRERRIVVPRAALRQEGEGRVVFVVAGERVERRAVTVGPASGDPAEVTSGLSPGEQVILDPPPGLAGGERVKVDARR
jgi:RND family efflux transporter MFP subunit